MPPTPPLHFLRVKSMAVAPIIGLNDVPIIADVIGEGVMTEEPVNRWLKPEGNRFTAYIAWPEDEPYEPGTARVESSLFIHDPAHDIPTPRRTLASFNWPMTDTPEGYPFPHEQPVEIPEPPPTRLWQDAAVIEELTDLDRREILDLIERFRAALHTGDADTALDLTRYRYSDEARAEGKPPDQLLEAVREQYEWLFEQGELLSDPLTPDQARFRIVADGQVILVSRPAMEPAVLLHEKPENASPEGNADQDEPPAPPESEADKGDQPDEEEEGGLSFGIDVYAAKIEGAWTIVR